MELHSLNCGDCGGAVAAEAGQQQSTCPFCGSAQTHSIPLDEQIELPESLFPFQIDAVQADAAYRSYAADQFWAPSEIRQAKLQLRAIFLPAWIWEGIIESHYAGLVWASSPSGKRPFAGTDRRKIDQVLVPASEALTHAELNSLRPFESEVVERFVHEGIKTPFELGQLTREAAQSLGMLEMKNRHEFAICSETEASALRCSSVFEQMEGKPSLLPIYIGVYRHREQPYRILVNGISGKLIGQAPLSLYKILAFLGLFLAAFGALILVAKSM
jgi:hypothetical protein